MRELGFHQAFNEALHEEMRRDSTVFYMGTGAMPITFGPLKGIAQDIGPDRLLLTPISESGFAGAAIGAAMIGARPIADLGLSSFAFVAFDQFINQAPNMHYMFGGMFKVPVVFKMGVGVAGGGAAQHSCNPSPIYMNIAGLKIVMPTTPYDVKGLLKTAIRDDNPVIFFEHSWLGGVRGDVPEEEYTIPFGVADVKREGKDVTIVAFGWWVHESLAVAGEMEKEGISVEVIDPRSLVPMDVDTILKSVRKTGRLVVVDDTNLTCSTASEVSALVCEDRETFRALKAPVQRVCSLNSPKPYSAVLEKVIVPSKGKIAKAIKETMAE